MILYRSLDTGQFYREADVDPQDRLDQSRYQKLRVEDTLVIQAEDLPGVNDIFELLARCYSSPCIEPA